MKFKADKIFTGENFIGNSVLITDERGIIQEIVPEADAGDGVQQYKGILSPGFVNCHCHLELSFLKGLIPEGTGLVDFVINVMTRRSFPMDEIETAIAKGEQEMIENGIVAVADICNDASTLNQKLRNNLRYLNFIEVSGFIPPSAEKRFEQGQQILNRFIQSGLDASVIVPHAPYSTSTELMKLINAEAAGKVLSMHNQETLQEETFFTTGISEFRKLFDFFKMDISFYQPPGVNSLYATLPHLNMPKNILLVHNTFTGPEDIFLAHQHSEDYAQDLFFCTCINANLYIEDTTPPLELLRKNNCTIVLGTDSLASNHSLSIWDEIKSIHQHFPNIELEEILTWSTANGAKALLMDKELGFFEKGMQPGVIVLPDWDGDQKIKRLV
ncbi:amidohydrolase family protein [Danxiaibacter flavus]|uniref:Amidohydrolase family protein n=1 Tax=Danxiaibacter flavus TaxID=3049108 RepID=A0ABV3ZKM9_9BACT|nr:amidohydrolase family protein [Chitinophagaceae bacterium DXS]